MIILIVNFGNFAPRGEVSMSRSQVQAMQDDSPLPAIAIPTIDSIEHKLV